MTDIDTLPDGRWFLISVHGDEWQFMKFNDNDFGWQPTCFRRHGEPFEGARERAIADGFVVQK